MYVAAYLHASVLYSSQCHVLSALRLRLATINFTLRRQLRRHQVLMRLQACNEFFAIRVVHVQWSTRVF